MARFTLHLAIAFMIAVASGSAYAQTGSPSSAPGGSGAPPLAYVWAGTWFSNHYDGGYVGGMTSLGNNNLWGDGFVVRLDASGGQYNYPLGNGNTQNVPMYDASVMLGYRKRLDNASTLTVFFGPSVETHQNSDPNAAISGTEAGARVFVDYSNKLNANTEFDLQGGYASPFASYNTTARLIFQVAPKLWVGPQATLYGNRSPYQEETFGGYLKYAADFGDVGFSAGYRHPSITTAGSLTKGDGYFASVYLGVPIK